MATNNTINLSHPFHDGHVNVVSAVGACITVIFFSLILTTAYLVYQVYFKNVTHFEALIVDVKLAEGP